MPRRRTSITPVEWIILLAIAGVLLSAMVPAAKQGKRARRPSRRAEVASGQRSPSGGSGQFNIIRTPEAGSGAPAQGAVSRRPRRPAAGLAFLVVATTTLLLLLRFAGQVVRRQRRRGRRSHPEGG
jgi:hypothetical protein